MRVQSWPQDEIVPVIVAPGQSPAVPISPILPPRAAIPTVHGKTTRDLLPSLDGGMRTSKGGASEIIKMGFIGIGFLSVICEDDDPKDPALALGTAVIFDFFVLRMHLIMLLNIME